MSGTTVAVIGSIVVGIIGIIALVFLAFMVSRNKDGTRTEQGPYAGLPTRAPPPPASVLKSPFLRKRWDEIMSMIFSVRSNCWAVNHFYRVAFLNDFVNTIKNIEKNEKDGSSMSDREKDQLFMDFISRVMLKAGSALGDCPRSTEVTFQFRNAMFDTTVGRMLDGKHIILV